MFLNCAEHRFLALSLALMISSVRNSLGVIKNIINLSRNITLDGQTLKNYTVKHVPESKRTRLVGLCKTSFIEQTTRCY